MAAEDKLLKSFDYLKNTYTSEFTLDTSQRSKEKIQHCLYVADAITSTTVKVLPNFHQLLSNTFEILFQLCNDNESDVRLKAEESLNKIIKAMDNENTNKVLIELHKEIKKNGAARSLKAAFWRFANLADLIRLPKRKQYVINLIPCIISVLERSEDILHETLMNSLPKILKSLGTFLSDNDIKMLLNNILKNINSSSAIIRRATVNCLLEVCINCRKSYNFLLFLFDTLLDCLISTSNSNGDIHLILGVLNGLKLLIPYIKNTESIQEIQGSFGITKKRSEVEVSEDKFLQVYEICMHFLLCSNDSIISASLDTLNTLLQNCTPEIKTILRSPNGLQYSTVDLPFNLYITATQRYKSPSASSKSLPNDQVENQLGKSETNLEILKSDEDPIKNLEFIHRSKDANDKVLRDSSSDVNMRKLHYEDINIGTFKDKEVPLIYCTRVICKLFLLTGHPTCTVSDTNIRISTKSLALACLSSIFEMYPQAFLLYLDKNVFIRSSSNEKRNSQAITDILLLGSHADPQLRGIVRIVVASFVKGVLRESNGSYTHWFYMVNETYLETFCLDRLIDFLMKGLQDVSSNCVRQSLTSLNICLRDILNSLNCSFAIALLELLPSIVKNSHWLVKTKLLDVIVDLPFLIIHSITGNEDFQNKIIFRTVFGLLEDEDQRVRTAAANAIIKIVPYVYFNQQRSVEAVAVERVNMYFYNLKLKDRENNRHMSDTAPFPFNSLHDVEKDNVRVALSKIVSTLHKLLLRNATNSIILGFIETLSLLSLTYPSIVYQGPWNSFRSYDLRHDRITTIRNSSLINTSSGKSTTKISSASDLVIVISCLLDNEIIYDINCHMHVLQVFGNLLAGTCVQNWQRTDLNVTTERPLWSMFHDKPLQALSESFLCHILKMLNIFAHIIDDTSLIEPKPVSPNLTAPGNASPAKTKKNNPEKNVESKGEEDDKLDKRNEPTKATGMGHFANSVHYMKLYDMLKVLYVNYKVTLTYDSSDNFLEFLNVLLKALSQILEIATIVESSRIAEEILSYLQTIFYLEPTSTVVCVHQLLKSLFGTNLVLNLDVLNSPNRHDDKLNVDTSLYYRLSEYHYEDCNRYNNIFKQKNRLMRNGDDMVMGYLHKKENKHVLIKSDKVLASYIRLFEPMVIKSLKHYTITSNVELQCSVLHLLNQLIQLKVNYCLLDSEQVFIKFIQKQFEFIEEGLIAQPEKLIPKIFYFLMNLSHGKQHSKSIISVPKVIQLCDGLMASGQSPLTYCIPALKPIVEDLFVVRNKANTADFGELEITREVLLSMLLRLFEYSEVTELLVIILNESKYCDNIEKWSKWSHQIYSILLAKLTHDKLKLDNGKNILSIMKLVISLNPTVFRSTNELLILLFQKVPLKNEKTATISRWFGKIIIIFVIILQSKEEVLLRNINESLRDFSPESIFDKIYVKSDPLNATNAKTYFEGLTPDFIFVKFIFRTLKTISYKCASMMKNKEDFCLTEQLSHFLVIFDYICQSGHYSEITNTIKRLINGDFQENHKILLDHLNENFMNINRHFPTITYQWLSLLTVVEYKLEEFWSNIEENVQFINFYRSDNKLRDQNSLFRDTARSAAVIAYCEYLLEHNSGQEELSSFTETNTDVLIRLCEEPPITNLISLIHRNSATSCRLVEKIGGECLNNLESSFVVKILNVLQNCHNTQSGFLIQILVENLLSCRHLAVLRMVVNLTCRKLEYLLTLKADEVRDQLPEKQLLRIANHIVEAKLMKKNETIMGFLNKLSLQVYGSPLFQDHYKCINTTYIKELKINKNWYLSQVISRDYLCDKNAATAKVLSQLGKGDIESFCSKEESRKLVAKTIISNADDIMSSKNDEILRLSVEFVFKDLINFLKMLPKSHQVYFAEAKQYFSLEETYSQQLRDIFEKKYIWQAFQELIPLAEVYANNFKQINSTETSTEMNFSIIVKFAVVCLESITFLLSNRRSLINLDYIERALVCANAILKIPEFINILASDVHITWLCSSVNTIYTLASFFSLHSELQSNIQVAKLPEVNVSQSQITIARRACYQLATVFDVVERHRHLLTNIPDLLYNMIRSITMALSKLPTVNSYVLTSTNVSKRSSLTLEYGGSFQTQVLTLPVDFLKDLDILEDFIFRVNRLGWSNRQQFEETWMSLLSILNLNLIEEKESGHATCFAIKSITTLLAQTLYEPVPGNPNNSKYFHVPRDAAISEAHTYVRKLKYIQNKFEKKIKMEADFLLDSDIIVNVFNKPNIDKSLTHYSSGQLSVAYLLYSSKTITLITDSGSPLVDKYLKRQRILEESGLDLNSCIQSLLDLYSQWINIQTTTSLKIFNEILKSLLIVSDLFQQKSQFLWMLDTCIELSKNPLLENEIFDQYLTMCICKAAAVLNPDMEVYELIKKILSQNIRSPLLSTRLSCLHSLLYVLEGCMLANTVIGGISEELQLLLPLITEYINLHIDANITVLNQSQEHNLAVWALTFFMIENIPEEYLPPGFVASSINAVMAVLKSKKHSASVYSKLTKALERLIIKKCLSSDLLEQVTKLALDKIKDCNAIQSLLSIQLLISSLYTECTSRQEDTDDTYSLQDNPDNLVQTIERVSIIFDRIKKGLPFEVEILCHVLPDIINDFFSPSDILTKIVGEFLSPQQKHPKLLSQVVFQVFESGISQSQLTLLQDWVVVSLSNFTQSFSVGMSTWYLNCFFISSSDNFWLRSIFPYVQSRIGRFEYEDKEILCIAARDFYNNLTTDKQRQIFLDTFRKVKDQTDMPFKDLLDSL